MGKPNKLPKRELARRKAIAHQYKKKQKKKKVYRQRERFAVDKLFQTMIELQTKDNYDDIEMEFDISVSPQEFDNFLDNISGKKTKLRNFMINEINRAECALLYTAFMISFGKIPTGDSIDTMRMALKRFNKNVPPNIELYHDLCCLVNSNKHQQTKFATKGLAIFTTSEILNILMLGQTEYSNLIHGGKRLNKKILDSLGLKFGSKPKPYNIAHALIDTNLFNNIDYLHLFVVYFYLSNEFSRVSIDDVTINGKFIDIEFNSPDCFHPSFLRSIFGEWWETLNPFEKVGFMEDNDFNYAFRCFTRDKFTGGLRTIIDTMGNHEDIYKQHINREMSHNLLWLCGKLWMLPISLYLPYITDLINYAKKWEIESDMSASNYRIQLTDDSVPTFDMNEDKVLHKETNTPPRDFLFDSLLYRIFDQYASVDYMTSKFGPFRQDFIQLESPISFETTQRFTHASASFVNRLQGRVNCPYFKRTKEAMNFVIDPDTKQLILNTGLPSKINAEFLYLPYQSMFLDVNLPLSSGELCEGILIHELDDEQYAEYVEKGHGDQIYCNLLTGEEGLLTNLNTESIGDKLVTACIGQEFDEYTNEQWSKKVLFAGEYNAKEGSYTGVDNYTGMKRLADQNAGVIIDIEDDGSKAVHVKTDVLEGHDKVDPPQPNKRHWIISAVITNGKYRYVTTNKIGVSTWDNMLPPRPRKSGPTKYLREIVDFIIGLLYFIQLPNVSFVDKPKSKFHDKLKRNRKLKGKPIWGKTQVVRLTGEVKRYVNSIALGEGNGRKFHLVRRHFRVLKSERYKEQGKVVWVKAHQRGWGGTSDREYEVRK